VITLKSPREIELIHEACRVVVEAHQLVCEMLQPGVKTKEIDAAVERLFDEKGATPLFKGVPGTVPFPAVTCISINEQVVHGIPGDRKLREGDLVSVDTGCRLDGWCGDAAWTYPVGEVDEIKQRLVQAGQAALHVAVEQMGRQCFWSQVAVLMEKEVRWRGFSVVEDFVGHGIGREMHEDPQVPAYTDQELQEHDFPLEPGLVLAIEPMVNAGSNEVYVCEDHWTVETEDQQPSAHFEHTVALTSEGPVVLTEGIGAGRRA